MLVGPGVLLFAVFVVAPLVRLVQYSLTDWNGYASKFNSVGLENYTYALTSDLTVRRSLLVTLFITLLATVILTVIGLGLAVFLNEDTRLARTLQSLFFLPIVLSLIVVGFLWRAMLSYDGVINSMLDIVGLGPVDFLGTPNNAVLSITGVAVWQTTGFAMVLYLAAVKGVPKELYEAAAVDGAGPWRIFAHLTVPVIMPTLTIITVILAISFMRTYEYVAALTLGGPGGASETLAYRVIREGTSGGAFGYASSIAVILLLLTLLLGGVLYRTLRSLERV